MGKCEEMVMEQLPIAGVAMEMAMVPCARLIRNDEYCSAKCCLAICFNSSSLRPCARGARLRSSSRKGKPKGALTLHKDPRLISTVYGDGDGDGDGDDIDTTYLLTNRGQFNLLNFCILS